MSRTVKGIVLVIGLASACLTSYPQTGVNPGGSVKLPILGFVSGGTTAIRPLMGVAGSASVGSPLDIGFGIVQPAMAPERDYVLALTSQDGLPVLLQTSANGLAVYPVDFFNAASSADGDCDLSSDAGPLRKDLRSSGCARRSPVHIDRIVLSPTGSAAALYSQSAQSIYRFANLPQQPALAGVSHTASLGSIDVFAVTDDAQTLAVGVSESDSGSVFLLSGDGEPRLVSPMRHPSVIQFFRNGTDAVIADDADDKVYEMSNGQVFPIAAAEDGISTPRFIAVSHDNTKVFVGNAGTDSIVTLSLTGAAATSIGCNCALAGLNPTNADSVFRLTDFSGGPVLLFDGSSAGRRFFFAPAASNF